jgi:hypothetical protein
VKLHFQGRWLPGSPDERNGMVSCTRDSEENMERLSIQELDDRVPWELLFSHNIEAES